MFRWRTWRLTAILLMLGAVALVFASCARGRGSFFLENAALRYPEKILELEESANRPTLPVFGHRIASGDRLILATRWYSGGMPFLIDDERYEKLTIEIREPLDGPATLSLGSGALAVYSSGGSAWPSGGCHGFLSGTLRIDRMSERRIGATLEAQVSRTPPVGFHAGCLGREIKRSLSLSRIEREDLTPYLGAATDNHPYSDTYP